METSPYSHRGMPVLMLGIDYYERELARERARARAAQDREADSDTDSDALAEPNSIVDEDGSEKKVILGKRLRE